MDKIKRRQKPINKYRYQSLKRSPNSGFFAYQLEDLEDQTRLIGIGNFEENEEEVKKLSSGIIPKGTFGLTNIDRPYRLFSRHHWMMSKAIHPLLHNQTDTNILFIGLNSGALQSYIRFVYPQANVFTLEENKELKNLFKEHINLDIGDYEIKSDIEVKQSKFVHCVVLDLFESNINPAHLSTQLVDRYLDDSHALVAVAESFDEALIDDYLSRIEPLSEDPARKGQNGYLIQIVRTW